MPQAAAAADAERWPDVGTTADVGAWAGAAEPDEAVPPPNGVDGASQAAAQPLRREEVLGVVLLVGPGGLALWARGAPERDGRFFMERHYPVVSPEHGLRISQNSGATLRG